MKLDLVGIGNALVDIEVPVDETFVARHKLTKGGMTLTTAETQRQIIGSLPHPPAKIASGGSAANTVHGVSVLGGSAYYLGRVAHDEYGRHYTDDMNRCGVGFPGPDGDSGGTGTCVVLVTPDTERTMLTHLGISAALHPENVDPAIVENCRAVYIEGYLWTGEETRSAALKMAEIARSHGIPVSFTLSDAFVAANYKESLLDFIRWNVDILFCNEVEGKTLTGAGNPADAFDTLQGLAGTTFFTRGKQGAWAGKAGEEKIAVASFPVKAVDTTGAGDLFAAGALYGLIKDHPLHEAAIIGSYCAAQVVTHFGARMPLNSHTRVNQILKTYASLPPADG